MKCMSLSYVPLHGLPITYCETTTRALVFSYTFHLNSDDVEVKAGAWVIEESVVGGVFGEGI